MMLIPTNDMDLIKSIAIHDDIWSRFSDGISKDDYFPSNNDREQWLVIIINGDTAGFIYINCESTCSISFHPYLVKKFRRYNRDMIKSFFNWFIENIPDSFVKINVSIPEVYKSAINTAKKTGFTQEGIIRDSYRVGDNVYNKIALGITRREIDLWVA